MNGILRTLVSPLTRSGFRLPRSLLVYVIVFIFLEEMFLIDTRRSSVSGASHGHFTHGVTEAWRYEVLQYIMSSMLRTVAIGVVNSRMRVYGLENVRVVDASVIPLAPTAALQPTVYAIAEKVCLSCVFSAYHIFTPELAGIRYDQGRLPTALKTIG